MILCVGEILVDMIEVSQDIEKINYQAFPGGAPFNVSCNIKKLGGKTGFVGNVGNDAPGRFLTKFYRAQHFDLGTLTIKDKENTTLAYVSIDKNGERDFSFSRNQCADYQFDPLTFGFDVFENANIIHFGSLMLSEPQGRKFLQVAIGKAHKLHKLVSFDINYRDDIFADNKEALAAYREIIPHCDILKFTEEELKMFGEKQDIADCCKALFNPHQLVFISLGRDGSLAFHEGKLTASSSISVTPIDSTGAGDAFYSAVLQKLDEVQNFSFDDKTLSKILRFANICGALTTQKYGAISAFPSLDEINYYLGSEEV